MYRIGLDIGTDSMGIAVVSLDKDKNAKELLYLNSYIFREPVTQKGTNLLNVKRRTNRLNRRQIERRKDRLSAIYHLANELGVCKVAIKEVQKKSDIYRLRADGINRELTLQELFAVLLNIVKNRGYKGNIRNADGVIKKAIDETKEKLNEFNVTTLGELKFNLKERSVRGKIVKWKNITKTKNVNGTFIDRKSIIREVDLILKEQEKHHPILNNESAYPYREGGSKVFKEKIKEIMFYQRPILWYKESIKKGVVFKTEVAPLSSLAFEKYRVSKMLGELRFNDGSTLNNDEKDRVEGLLQKKESVLLEDIYKELNITDKMFKKDANIKSGKLNNGYKVERTLRKKYKGFESLKLGQKEEFIRFLSYLTNEDEVEITGLDKLIKNLNSTDEELIGFINRHKKELKPLPKLKLRSGRASYSIELLNVLTKYCKDENYDELTVVDAIKRENGVSDKNVKIDRLDLRNPIVRRALKEVYREISYVIKKMRRNGYDVRPYQMSVELAKETKRSLYDRNNLNSKNSNNYKNRELLKKELISENVFPSERNIKKLQLCYEQECRCAYSGKCISIPEIEDYELESIVPQSCGGSMAMSNMVLACKEVCKGNESKTPYELLVGTSNEKYLEETIAGLEELYKRPKISMIHGGELRPDRDVLKRKIKLLKSQKSAAELGSIGFMARNFTDTSYIGRILSKWLRDEYYKEESRNGEDRVITTVSTITNDVKRVLGLGRVLPRVRMSENKPLLNEVNEIIEYDEYEKSLDKNIRDSDEFDILNKDLKFNKRCDYRYHAIDALSIALTDFALVKKLQDIYRNRNSEIANIKAKHSEEYKRKLFEIRDKYSSEITSNIKSKVKIENIDEVVEKRLRGYVVWHKPDRHGKSDFFQETFYGLSSDGYFTKRVDILEISKKDDKLFELRDKSRLINKIERIIAPEIREIMLNKLQHYGKRLNREELEEFLTNIEYRGSKIKKVRIKYGKVAPQKYSDRDFAKKLGNGGVQYSINGGYSCCDIHYDESGNFSSYEIISNYKYRCCNAEELNKRNIVRIHPNDTIYYNNEFYLVRSFAEGRGDSGIKVSVSSEAGVYDKVKNSQKIIISPAKLKDIKLIKDRKEIALIKQGRN